MEGTMYICTLLYLCLGNFAASQLILDVEPNVTDVTENSNVVIRCSLNMLRPKTDVVYSIMIKRRGKTSAVFFKNGEHEISEEHVSLEESSISKKSATLQLNVKNVTCVDRGDYSCKMAVRRSYRNLQLGPVISPLKVIGKPSSVVFNVDPQKKVYSTGETVRVMCYTLQRTRISGWSWIVANQSKQDKMDTCVYSDDDCLYKCSSTIPHRVSMDDEKADFVCSLNGMSAIGALDVTNVSMSNDLTSTSSLWIYDNTTTHSTTGPSVNETNILTVFLPAIAVTAIVTGIVIVLVIYHVKVKALKGDLSLGAHAAEFEESHLQFKKNQKKTVPFIKRFWSTKTHKMTLPSLDWEEEKSLT